MWNFLLFFCLGGYLTLLIVLCIFVRKCMNLQYQIEDLKDKLFVLDMEVFGPGTGCDPGCYSFDRSLADLEDPEVR